MQLVNLSNAEKYYTYTLTSAPATTLMPVFITLNLHPGQEKSTVNSSCHAIPNFLTDTAADMKFTTDMITGTMYSTEECDCIVLL